ncbi:hypothetical protein WJX77_001525 [Trebouxia sp. C0004]
MPSVPPADNEAVKAARAYFDQSLSYKKMTEPGEYATHKQVLEDSVMIGERVASSKDALTALMELKQNTVAATAAVPAVGAVAFECSNEDMAAAMAKIAELEAANAGLKASAKKKDAALGNISAMSLEAQGLPNGGAVGPAAASPLVFT